MSKTLSFEQCKTILKNGGKVCNESGSAHYELSDFDGLVKYVANNTYTNYGHLDCVFQYNLNGIGNDVKIFTEHPKYPVEKYGIEIADKEPEKLTYGKILDSLLNDENKKITCDYSKQIIDGETKHIFDINITPKEPLEEEPKKIDNLFDIMGIGVNEIFLDFGDGKYYEIDIDGLYDAKKILKIIPFSEIIIKEFIMLNAVKSDITNISFIDASILGDELTFILNNVKYTLSYKDIKRMIKKIKEE